MIRKVIRTTHVLFECFGFDFNSKLGLSFLYHHIQTIVKYQTSNKVITLETVHATCSIFINSVLYSNLCGRYSMRMIGEPFLWVRIHGLMALILRTEDQPKALWVGHWPNGTAGCLESAHTQNHCQEEFGQWVVE